MYALVEWTEEEKVSIITLSRIKDPRKEFSLYKVGDLVKASCHGFPGVHPAKIFAIRGIHSSKFLLTMFKHKFCQDLF